VRMELDGYGEGTVFKFLSGNDIFWCVLLFFYIEVIPVTRWSKSLFACDRRICCVCARALRRVSHVGLLQVQVLYLYCVLSPSVTVSIARSEIRLFDFKRLLKTHLFTSHCTEISSI